MLVSSMVSSSKKSYKCFISYIDDDHKINPLYIMLPNTSADVKIYDGETKWMYFSIEDDEFLEKDNDIW